jgi:hypothetical protein
VHVGAPTPRGVLRDEALQLLGHVEQCTWEEIMQGAVPRSVHIAVLGASIMLVASVMAVAVMKAWRGCAWCGVG